MLRHSLFWLAAILFFELSYFFPYYWFHGWNIQDIAAVQMQAKIGVRNFYLLALTNSVLGIIPQIAFTYILIYLLLPRLLIKEKYIAFTFSLLVALFVSIIIFFSSFRFINPYIRIAFGLPPRVLPIKELITHSLDLVLFNCPTIGGIAVGIKLLKYWWLKQKESQQLATAKASAELQLLKAQVHPHFLFNTLNNIYSFTLSASPEAPELVKKLSDILRYIIYECNQPGVPLKKELSMIQDYMSLENIRYGEQMDMQVAIRDDDSGKMIAPLLLIPFVENSFKHGASKMLSKPRVILDITISNETLYFKLSNSKPKEYIIRHNAGGIGLVNVQKRLQLLYPGRHTLLMTEEQEYFTVILEIDLNLRKEKTHVNKKFQDYEMV
jgi:sensor histidine kinase YesM